MDDHQFREEEIGSVGELSTVCSQIVLKCLYLARIGRPDILWSVNKLARAVTKWTKACDKRLARLVSYIHILPVTQKSTSGGILFIFGSHTFIPRNWMCKKQTSVSHSFSEAEEIFSMQVYAWMGFPLSIFGIQ